MKKKFLSHDKVIFEGVKIFNKDGFWKVSCEKNKIISIDKSEKKTGGILTPRFSDIHVHLDKTGTAKRTIKRAKSLFEAITLMEQDKKFWSEQDIYYRANCAIESAWRHGTGFIRTHVDWENKKIPLAWNILKTLQTEWKDRVKIEMVSLSPLDRLDLDGEEIAKKVKENNSILGSFIYRNENLDQKISKVFQIADKYDLSLDFHVDEGLEKEANGIDYIIDFAKKFKMKRRVLCGHGCSLSIRRDSKVLNILQRAAEAEVGLTCLPTTNSWLQDYRKGRTPRLRGLAPIIEARNAGVSVMIASDNCQDFFYPFGNHDLLSVFKTAVINAHLDEEKWFDSITHIPANWMGVRNEIEVGSEASFIWFDFDSLKNLMNTSHYNFNVWNKGKMVTEIS